MPRMVSTSSEVCVHNEAEELADSPNIRLLKTVEETSEDCLRRVASRVTVVCHVLVCVESRQTVLRKRPTMRCNSGISQSYVCVFSLEGTMSVFEGRSIACLLTRAKPFDISIERRIEANRLRRNTALSNGAWKWSARYLRSGSTVSPSFSSSSCAQTDSVQGAEHWSEFDRGGVAFDFSKFVSVVFRKGEGHGHGGRIIEACDRDDYGFISADESRHVMTILIEPTGEEADEMILKLPPESTEEERPSY